MEEHNFWNRLEFVELERDDRSVIEYVDRWDTLSGSSTIAISVIPLDD